jgi:hypothetical protein
MQTGNIPAQYGSVAQLFHRIIDVLIVTQFGGARRAMHRTESNRMFFSPLNLLTIMRDKLLALA